jgi:uncharacterized protein YbjT (DUF2867 family)
VDGVFMATPLSQDETERGLAAVSAARKAGIKRLVYMTVHNLEAAPHIPHFASKFPVVKAIKESGIAWTLLEPNNFYQNDFWFMDVITKFGVYPQPIGNRGLSRVDARDIADAAVNALTGAGHEGKHYPMVGPEALTGNGVAETYSRHLNREVRYGGDDLDAWAEQAKAMMPEWLVHDLCIMYKYFQDSGLVATEEDLERQAKVLHHPPRTFEAFVAEVAGSLET